MHVSARVDYAVRALVELAAADPARVKVDELATAQDLPSRFLESIMGDLRRAGLVVSHRGPDGGYELGRPAAEVSVADVMRVLDGPLAEVRGMRPERREYAGHAESLTQVWVAARASLRSVLEAVSIAQIAAGKLPPAVSRLVDDPDSWALR